MSKAILEFDLNDSSDRLEHKRMLSSTDVFLALNDIDNMLRGYTKHYKDIDVDDTFNLPNGSHRLTEIESELLHAFAEVIRHKIIGIVNDRDINMDDLE